VPVGEIYVKLVVGFPRDPKVRALVRFGEDAGLARDLYVQMLLYCADEKSDGWVPAEEVGVLAYPLSIDRANQLANQLASVGLTKAETKDGSEGWHVIAYLKRNKSKADIERLSRVRAESGRKGGRPPTKPAGEKSAEATGNQVGKQNQSRPNPYTDTEDRYREDQKRLAGDSPPPRPKASPKAPREDAERLCVLLAGQIEANGSKRPAITQRWRDAARLMLDRDGYAETQIAAAIDWCQRDEFWHRNILSMPKLRQQYERLRLDARAERDKNVRPLRPAPPHQPTHEEFDALRDNWARPMDEQEARNDPPGNDRPSRVHRGHLPAAEDQPGDRRAVV
jgi:hypothetical protein